MSGAPATVAALTQRQFVRQRRRRAFADFWRRLRQDRLAMLGLLVLAGFSVMALIAPWISPKSGLSATASIDNPLWHPPSREFPMGTDNLGRSVAAQFVWGSRISLLVGLAATVLTIAIGSLIGITSGFFGGPTDTVLMRITDWFLVIPFLPLAIALAAVLDRSIWNIILVIGVTSWPGTARLIRAQVLTVKQRLYVDRARSLGASGGYVVRRHILPNVAPLILANVTLAVPISILTETTLSFLGLGDPNHASWGKTLEEAFTAGAITRHAWWYYWPAGLGIVCVVLAFTLFGRAMEEILDPRPRTEAQRVSVLELRDLHVTYRSERGYVPAVRGVDLEINEGETVGLAGESGCGKSTIAASVLRLLPKSAEVTGKVILDGEDVYAMTPGRLRAVRWTSAAVVFQGALHSLNPVRPVGDQIEEAIHLHSRDDENTARRRTGELLERVGIPARRGRAYPHQMSGGQRQRVLIVLALACEPKLLIADEPTTALDVMVQAQVLELLAELQRDNGLALLFITHDLSVLTSTCERLAVMYAGRIVEDGPSEQVFADPLHPYSAGLARAFPTIGDPTSRMNPRGLAGDPPHPGLLPTGCPFHPRCERAIDECSTVDIQLVTAAPNRHAACVHVRAQGAVR